MTESYSQMIAKGAAALDKAQAALDLTDINPRFTWDYKFFMLKNSDELLMRSGTGYALDIWSPALYWKFKDYDLHKLFTADFWNNEYPLLTDYFPATIQNTWDNSLIDRFSRVFTGKDRLIVYLTIDWCRDQPFTF
jgi:hypothetical protein